MRNLMLQRILACPKLPSLPSVAVQVLDLARDEDVQLLEIARVVQHDQALTAKILRTANSSYFGLAHPCPTVSRAILYLGLNAVKSLVLSFSLIKIADPKSELATVMNLWRRSLFTAVAGRRIAALNGLCDPEETFLAALMQDIGMLAMHATLDRQYLDLVRRTGGDHLKLIELERATFNFDHTVAGAELGKHWKLPAPAIEVIRHHHDLQPRLHHHTVRSVGLGSMFADALMGERGDADVQRIRRCGEAWFDFQPEQMRSVFESLAKETDELATLFELDLEPHGDVDAVLAEAEEAAQQHILQMSHETDRLRRDNITLARKAHTDRMTGLANRCKFDESLRAMFHAAQKEQRELAIVLIDIDSFKPLNDTLGHLAGDAVLAALGYRLLQLIPEEGIACRYGGEEYVLLVPGMTQLDAAELAEQARRHIGTAPINLSNVPIKEDSASVTVSIGVAVLDATNARMLNRSKLLFAAADRALYAAKRAGRNCVRIFCANHSSEFENASYDSVESVQNRWRENEQPLNLNRA